MAKLATIFLLSFYFNSYSAKIAQHLFNLDIENGDSYIIDVKPDVSKQKNYRDSATIWVLSLNDNFTRMKPADKAERKIFRTTVEPAIESYVSTSYTRVKKDDPFKNDKIEQHITARLQKTANKKPTSQETHGDISSIDGLRRTIKRNVNKFLLSSQQNPTQSLKYGKKNREPSLKLYFKGPYTSLVSQSNHVINHYFISPDSSLVLPHWFYESHKDSNHESVGFVEVPEEVKNDFYEKLVIILQELLGYPV